MTRRIGCTWIGPALLALCAVAAFAGAAVQQPDVALRGGSVGFDSVAVFASTRDGSLLVGGERWAAMDFGGHTLPSIAPPDDFASRARAPSAGFLARIELDGRVRFLTGPDLGAAVSAAAELADGRLFVAGVTRDRTSTWGGLALPHRGDDLVGFGMFLTARGAPERALPLNKSGNVWVRGAAASGDAVVVVGSFDGVMNAARPLSAHTQGTQPYSDGFVLSLGPDGAARWGARVGSETFTDGAERVVTLTDGTILVTGTVGRDVTFEDGRGVRKAVRCGDPVSCPFLWGLDPDTGATRFHNVLKNGSGSPDAVAVVAAPDGGFIVGGGMGRNLRVGSAIERKRGDTVTLRAPAPVGFSWLARFGAGGALAWTRRIDADGSLLRSLALLGPHVVLVGSGDLGARPRRGEGPATLARVRADDGAFVDAVAFGRPRDAPLTQSEDNLRTDHVLVTTDGRVALAGTIEERAWLHLSAGPIELTSVGAGAPGFANEMDVFVAVVRDPLVLASTALPPRTTSREDPFEGCVARREGALIIPCEPDASTGRRAIHHTCIAGTRGRGDRRVWSCGALDDEVPLQFAGLELFFLEPAPGGRLALYGEHVGTGECGGLSRMACKVTARLLDGDGGARWSHDLSAGLNGASDTSIAEVVLAQDTLYVVEACWGYELGHRGRCDQLIAMDAVSGRVRWRSAPLAAHGTFAVSGEIIVAFSPGTHGTSKSKRHDGRLVALDKQTGALLGALPAVNVIDLRVEGGRVLVTQEERVAGPQTTHEVVLKRDGKGLRLSLR